MCRIATRLSQRFTFLVSVIYNPGQSGQNRNYRFPIRPIAVQPSAAITVKVQSKKKADYSHLFINYQRYRNRQQRLPPVMHQLRAAHTTRMYMLYRMCQIFGAGFFQGVFQGRGD